MSLNYYNTFIQVADDCPVTSSVVPAERSGKQSIAVIQYELLAEHPYEFTQEDVLFETFARHKAVPEEEHAARRAEFFSKSQACLRTSPLPKSYGWGLHFDAQGRVALCPVESEAYRRFVEQPADGLKLLKGMRSRRT
jgi:hypothetical protein